MACWRRCARSIWARGQSARAFHWRRALRPVQPGRRPTRIGAGLKVCSIHPDNSLAIPGQAAFLVIDEQSKDIDAVLDGPQITRWQTAADCALATQRPSREDISVLLALGAGLVAQALTGAYLHIHPAIHQVLLHNRVPSRLAATCDALNHRGFEARIVDDLDAALAQADIITSANSSLSPWSVESMFAQAPTLTGSVAIAPACASRKIRPSGARPPCR